MEEQVQKQMIDLIFILRNLKTTSPKLLRLMNPNNRRSILSPFIFIGKTGRGSLKKGSDAMQANSKKSIMGLSNTTETSLLQGGGSRIAIFIRKIQSNNMYKALYLIMYYWLALSDHFRLLFISKSGDVIFYVFTLIFVSKYSLRFTF